MSKSNPKVSIVMSVYNGEDHLREALESILNQSFKDFEFIIIDDSSSDNSWAIITEYAELDQRIRLFKNENNIGLTKSLNKGLTLTQGKYIARQDADDISLPNRLQLQVDFLDAHPEVGALGSAIEFIDDQGSVSRQLEVPTDHETLQAVLLVNNCLWHSSMTIAAKQIQQIGGYDEQFVYAQDYDLWWRIGRHSRLATLSDILLQYRLDNSSAITKLKRKQQLEFAQIISFRAIQESLPETALSLDKSAYERFWWAYIGLVDSQSYQQCWYSDRGEQALLKRQDIRQLQPLWHLLATFPGASEIWGCRIRQLAYLLLHQKQVGEGFQLLWITLHQFKLPIQWGKAIRALVKPYIPTPGQQLWQTWKTSTAARN